MRRTSRILLASLVPVLIVLASTAAAKPPAPSEPDLGPNVLVFDPSMPVAQIQAAVDAVANQQVGDEFGSHRHALLFKPGTYGSVASPLMVEVGYYTEVAGLGASPGDVVVNGHVDVYNRCLAPDNCVATENFWRSLSNLTINVMGASGCYSSGNFWAVSQGSPMRRVSIAGGNLSLMDYCTAGPQYASGGFIADSQTGFIINGSQQQFLVRNSSIGGWSNGVWNQVFSGVVGAPDQSFGSTPYNPPPYTTLATSPETRERPFLYVDSSGQYQVFVPALRRDSEGTSWSSGAEGSSLPIGAFFIAKPSDSAQAINNALSRGKHLIFTPGVYHLDRTIAVKRADAVVLGLGFPTLVADNGIVAMAVDDVKGVKVAGLLFDAGSISSPALLQIGTPGGENDQGEDAAASNPDAPTSLHDVFFRVGGAAPGKAAAGLVVNSDHVLLDDVWMWRAEYGSGVGWTDNTADTGLVVNGDDVTAYGLFVEHFQKDQVVWNGERGRTIFFQSEMPFDPPDQAAWSHGDVQGYAAYKVADGVATHEGWGLETACAFEAEVDATRAFEVPSAPGVALHDLVTVFLNGQGGIEHVVNDTGARVDATNQVTNVVSYP